MRAEMHLMTICIEECEDNPKNLKLTFVNYAEVKGNVQKMFNMILSKTFPKMIEMLE